MNPILKGAIAFGTVAGVGGTSYGIYNAMQTTSEKIYSEILEGTLLTATDDSQQESWKSRLLSLQTVKATELVEGIQTLKTPKGNEQWKELKKWCQDTIKQPNKGKNNKEFANIQNYCTFSIKEKITDAVNDSASGNDETKWKAAYDKLQAINDGLDSELTALKSKQDSTKYTEVKKWCNTQYAKPYKGADDKDFKNASRICLSK